MAKIGAEQMPPGGGGKEKRKNPGCNDRDRNASRTVDRRKEELGTGQHQ
jgi:hypothetical protein